MSIYATLWALKFPRFGDHHAGCDWVTVFAQGVPAHVGEEIPDPYAAFLPERSSSIAAGFRAVVFVTEGAAKGTHRSVQEYQSPLLVVAGTKYASLPFSVVHEGICEALRGSRPKLLAELLQPDGSTRAVFDDGSIIDSNGAAQ